MPLITRAMKKVYSKLEHSDSDCNCQIFIDGSDWAMWQKHFLAACGNHTGHSPEYSGIPAPGHNRLAQNTCPIVLLGRHVVPFTPQFQLQKKMPASLSWPITGIFPRTTAWILQKTDENAGQSNNHNFLSDL
jgi:hypothetical protein